MTSHGLDPEVAALMSGPPPTEQPGPPDLEQLRESAIARTRSEPVGPHVEGVRDVVVALRDRSVRSRVYQGNIDDILVMFFHGGGFVTGDIDTQDAQARMVSAVTGRTVVSVDYRLAPEHPFPAAYDDAVETTAWCLDHASELVDVGAPPARIAVAGPSAGGNLAVGVSLALAGTPAGPVAQLLAYPMLGGDRDLPSRTEFATGYGLTSQAIEWCTDHYLADPSQRTDPRFAPLHSDDLAAMPPTVILSAGFDPLRDESRAFGQRLVDEGVHVQNLEAPTLPHGFWKYAPRANAAQLAALEMCRAFRDFLDIA